MPAYPAPLGDWKEPIRRLEPGGALMGHRARTAPSKVQRRRRCTVTMPARPATAAEIVVICGHLDDDFIAAIAATGATAAEVL